MTRWSKLSRSQPPADAAERRGAPAVTVYRLDMLPEFDAAAYAWARQTLTKIDEVVVPPREARAFKVPAGHFFRIFSIEGPQVGDLNLWNASDLSEHFFSGKTRALHATHVTTGDRLWSSFPGMRPLATITHDTLDWYGWDEDGGGIHDVIGTRCVRRRLPSFLPFQSHAGACRSGRTGTLRGRALRPRRIERLHVHWIHPGHPSIFQEGESGTSGRFSGIVCRD